MRLYIARHGETDHNRNRLMQGYREIPINDRGIAQAAQLAHRLDGESVERIVSSDLRRAVMTACVAAARIGAPMEYNAGLRERDPGLLTGRSYDDEPRFFTDESYLPPEGEGVAEFRARVRATFEAITADRRHDAERVLVVTHGLVCHAFVHEFFGPELAEGVGAHNAALTVAEFRDGAWLLIDRACAAHLVETAAGRAGG